MILSTSEYRTFFKAHLDLLYFIAQNNRIIPENASFHDFVETDLATKMSCRDLLIENKAILDDYLQAHSKTLSNRQRTIIRDFKRAITGDFIIYQCLRDYAVFIHMQDNQFYGVKALGDRFDQLFNDFPALVNATILPFGDKIIYDGFLVSQPLRFGPSYLATINKDYGLALREKRIKTRL